VTVVRQAVRRDEPLARHTSLRVGGPARRYAESMDPHALIRAMREAADGGLPILVLGGGSNLLPADAGFDGLVARYIAAGFTVERSANGEDTVVATGGVTIANLARRLARQGWSGLEWAANVPGTVGGAAVNNAGAFGSCMAESLVELTLLDLDGGERTLSCAELEYAYRSSRLKRGKLSTVLVLVVRCRLRAGDPAATTARVAEFQRQRTASQPRQLSAGSVFANPPGGFAGRLIEQAGLKGVRRGEAEISRQHANFIVNLGHATAADVYELMRSAQDAVWDRAGVWLQPEIQLVGAWEDGQVERLRGPAGAGVGG